MKRRPIHLPLMLGLFVVLPFLGWRLVSRSVPVRSLAPFKESLARLEKQGLSTNAAVALPRGFSSLTVDGYVYVTPRPNGRWILYRTWLGKGGNLHGYLYTSGEELELDEGIDVVTQYPNRVGVGTVTVQSKHDDSWYFVVWNTD